MLSAHAEKWGDASPPPRPPPIDARASDVTVNNTPYNV